LKINIILVDNEIPFSETIKNLVLTQNDFHLAGIGYDGYDAINLTGKIKPDVIILSSKLPVLDGLKAVPLLHSHSPASAIIIVFADEVDDSTIINAARCGIKGFLLRGSMFEDVNMAIRTVNTGCGYMSQGAAIRTFDIFCRMVMQNKQSHSASISNAAEGSPAQQINSTELQIAIFIGQGLSNRQIADMLRLKIGTIRNYISIILKKTNLKDRTQIAIYVLEEGLGEKYSTDEFKYMPAESSQLKFGFDLNPPIRYPINQNTGKIFVRRRPVSY
jgi:DNA-binding NarL/FixJ family response regulator